MNLEKIGLFNGWQLIQAAINTRRIEDRAKLFILFGEIGLVYPGITTAPDSELAWVCEALYWQGKSDDHAMAHSEMAQKAHTSELYTQELFSENEKLRAENTHLRTALKLEHDYAARPEVTQLLGGPGDKAE